MKIKISKLFLIIGLVLVSILMFTHLDNRTPSASLSVQEKLDNHIQKYIGRLGIPGASVAISHKGDLIYSQSFGPSIEKDTRFYIGSTTKSFTALAIAQLAHEKKIELDESVSSYISEFKVSDSITVRHLVYHVSGMSENEYSSWGALYPDDDFSDLVSDLNTMNLTSTPGEEFAYFNPNYSLLGYIIETVSGQS